MAALLSSQCQCRFSAAALRSSVSARRSCFDGHQRPLWFRRLGFCCSSSSSRFRKLDSGWGEVPVGPVLFQPFTPHCDHEKGLVA